MRLYVCIYMYVSVYVYVCTCAMTLACMYVCVCMYEYMCEKMRVYASTCFHIRLLTLRLYSSSSTHLHFDLFPKENSCLPSCSKVQPETLHLLPANRCERVDHFVYTSCCQSECIQQRWIHNHFVHTSRSRVIAEYTKGQGVTVSQYWGRHYSFHTLCGFGR